MNADEGITAAYRLLFQRAPSEREQRVGSRSFCKQAGTIKLEAICQGPLEFE